MVLRRRGRYPIGFAHRGAPGDGVQENTLPAFRAALAAGVPALESDVWVTADGEPVLLHDGALRMRWRKRPVATLLRRQLPSWVPTLAALYDACGTEFELSLDIKDPAAAAPVIAVARAAGGGAVGRLWLCADVVSVSAWRGISDDLRLVDSTRLKYLGAGGVAARARALRDAGVNAINLPFEEWRGPWVDDAHAAGRLAFGWDAHDAQRVQTLLEFGVDAVYSDHVELLTRYVYTEAGERSRP